MSAGTRYAREHQNANRRLFGAFGLSLFLHALLFGGFELGQRLDLWEFGPMKLLRELTGARSVDRQARFAAMEQQQARLVFTDVDPTRASAAPPEEAQYYGAADMEAANPDPKIESDVPQVDGSHTDFPKATEPVPFQPEPLQPNPILAAAPPETSEPPAPEPEPAPEPRPEASPQQAPPEGGLVAEPPREETIEGADEAEQEPSPATLLAAAEPPSPRPLTLRDARRQQGMASAPMRQEGGVSRIEAASLDVRGTPLGSYDAAFVRAVEQRWLSLVQQRSALPLPGRVVVEFRLYYDGRITDLRVVDTQVGPVDTLMCEKAIQDPAPFNHWPPQMRREMPADHRDVRFTFHYR